MIQGEAIVKKAFHFAQQAHQGQVRKYTGEPYINHPVAVAKLVAEVCDNKEMVAAALLHDTVEDTAATILDIRREFGKTIAIWVEQLTKVSQSGHGNRAVRKALDRAHTALADHEAKTIKLADVFDNIKNIAEKDPKFAQVYMQEKRDLLEVLTEGDQGLYARVQKIIDDFFASKE